MSSPQALHRQLFWKNLCIRHLVFSLFYSHCSKRFRQQVLWGKDFPSCLPQAVWICNIHTLEEKEVFPPPKGSFFLKSPCTCFPLCSQHDLLIADCKNTTQGSSEWNSASELWLERNFPEVTMMGLFFSYFVVSGMVCFEDHLRFCWSHQLTSTCIHPAALLTAPDCPRPQGISPKPKI